MNRKQRRADKSRTGSEKNHASPTVQGLFNEALRHHQAGRLAEAEQLYRQILNIDPHHVDSLHLLGVLARQAGQPDIAVTLISEAIRLKNDAPMLYVNLANALLDQNNLNEAMRNYQRALALKPDFAEALNNLGSVFTNQGRLDDAIACYKKAIPLQPGFSQGYSNLLLAMIYAASVSPEELTEAARAFGETAKPFLRDRTFPDRADPERKLRIGYVSPDFYHHAVSSFFESLLTRHNRRDFEIFGYSNALREDHVTARLKGEFDHWRNIRLLSDDKAADLIEADAIDILIDLAGHTAENRLMVFARKPAPVQVTWLGFPATTGLTAMDYRITDSYAEPPGMTEHLNAETLWRLPEIFCCYGPHEKNPPLIDHPPFEDNGYITFGCFNNFAKVTDPVLEAWRNIMEKVADSQILLEIRGIDNPEFRTSVEARMKKKGLLIDRVILEPRKPSNQYVLYNRIDIALDPFPCAGGTTSFDTVWMGVPFVTLAGEHFVSRMGVTILTNAGMPELIAKNQDEYVDLAVKLALDKDRLRGLRHNLRQKVAASPIMNQAAFARNMEDAYREMWRKWCAR